MSTKPIGHGDLKSFIIPVNPGVLKSHHPGTGHRDGRRIYALVPYINLTLILILQTILVPIQKQRRIPPGIISLKRRHKHCAIQFIGCLGQNLARRSKHPTLDIANAFHHHLDRLGHQGHQGRLHRTQALDGLRPKIDIITGRPSIVANIPQKTDVSNIRQINRLITLQKLIDLHGERAILRDHIFKPLITHFHFHKGVLRNRDSRTLRVFKSNGTRNRTTAYRKRELMAHGRHVRLA